MVRFLASLLYETGGCNPLDPLPGSAPDIAFADKNRRSRDNNDKRRLVSVFCCPCTDSETDQARHSLSSLLRLIELVLLQGLCYDYNFCTTDRNSFYPFMTIYTFVNLHMMHAHNLAQQTTSSRRSQRARKKVGYARLDASRVKLVNRLLVCYPIVAVYNKIERGIEQCHRRSLIHSVAIHSVAMAMKSTEVQTLGAL